MEIKPWRVIQYSASVLGAETGQRNGASFLPARKSRLLRQDKQYTKGYENLLIQLKLKKKAAKSKSKNVCKILA